MPILDQVVELYPKRVKLVFKNFPLRSHKFANQAAAAALAAQKQGKFWEYHDILFKNYRSINNEKIKGFAKALGLDMGKFNKDLKDAGIKSRVKQDIKDGVQAGARGTPTVFINGIRLQDRSLNGFKAGIEKELSRKK